MNNRLGQATLTPAKTRPGKRSRRLSSNSSSVDQSLLYTNANLLTTNVYAEVRGKYARPAPPLHQAIPNFTFLTPKNNSLVSRPSTAGSLRRSASIHSNKQEQAKQAQEAAELAALDAGSETRSMASERSRPRTASVRIRKNTAEREKTSEDKKEEKLDEEVLVENEEQEKSEEGSEGEDRSSQASWVTTSSHRRYIEELEALLREERMRRIKAEQALEKQSN